MGTYDYSGFVSLASRMAGKFGRSIIFTKVTGGSYDPSVRSVVKTETQTAVNAIVLNASAGKVSAFDEQKRSADGLGLEARRFLIIPGDALASPPEPGDRVTLDGEEWNVVGSTPINPGGSVIVYRVGINQ